MSHRSTRRSLLISMVLSSAAGQVYAQNSEQHPEVASAAQSSSANHRVVRHTSSLAYYYSHGDYRELTPTRVRYVPFSHEVAVDSWRFKAIIPWLEVAGPGNVLVNLGNVGQQAETWQPAPVSGRGDVLVSATYELPIWSETAPFIDFGVELKLPTAEETKGLGTGKMDVGAQLDVYQMLGRTTAFATLSYRYRRSSPYFEQLHNSWALSLGGSRSLHETIQAGLIYDYRQAVSEFTEETHELLPYLSWSPDSRWSLMVYFSRGFSDDSPDRAVGMQLGLRW